MSMHTNKKPANGEWQTDPKTGERYRIVGNSIEHEMMVRIDGIEVPQSQLADFNRRRKEAAERRRAADIERLKNAPPFVLCPLSDMNAMNNGCTREKCALFVENACSLAKIAAGEPNETTGKRCPIMRRTCSADCALNNGGCIITTFGKE